MGDEEDKETIFQEAAKRAWVRVFIREASKRGYTSEDIVALLDLPGMTVEAAVERILTREPKPTKPSKKGLAFSPARARVHSPVLSRCPLEDAVLRRGDGATRARRPLGRQLRSVFLGRPRARLNPNSLSWSSLINPGRQK